MDEKYTVKNIIIFLFNLMERLALCPTLDIINFHYHKYLNISFI